MGKRFEVVAIGTGSAAATVAWKLQAAGRRAAVVDSRPYGVKADLVVHGAGRVPEVDDLGLEEANVDHGPRGIAVNDFLQSVSNLAIYAAGDVAATDGPPLTPVAGYEGSIVAGNILEGNHRKPNYAGIPSVVYTIPNLASVGLGVELARKQNLKFRVNHQPTEGWYSSRRSNTTRWRRRRPFSLAASRH